MINNDNIMDMDSEESLEFLLDYLKEIIMAQEDKEITKVGDIAQILSDFMNTFLIVIDTLMKIIQTKFGDSDQKLVEFENLLLKSSVQALSGLTGKLDTVKQTSKPKTTKYKPIPQVFSEHPPPPPTPQEVETFDVDSLSDDMGLEDIASAAFTHKSRVEQIEKQQQQHQQQKVPTSGASFRMTLMDELKKKLNAQKEKITEKTKIDTDIVKDNNSENEIENDIENVDP